MPDWHSVSSFDSPRRQLLTFAARRSRKVFDKLVTAASSFSYDTVLELDQEYRDLLAQIPAEDPEREGERPHLRWKR